MFRLNMARRGLVPAGLVAEVSGTFIWAVRVS